MKFLFDILPVGVFFLAYQFGDIYTATIATMIATAVQLVVCLLVFRKIDTMLKGTAGIVFILGGLTLALHNPAFIKWKPTLAYWSMATALFVSLRFFKRNLIRVALEDKLKLPDPVWLQINTAWIAFFTVMGALNLGVAYYFSEKVWVGFKLGCIGITFIFVIGLMKSISRHLPDESSS